MHSVGAQDKTNTYMLACSTLPHDAEVAETGEMFFIIFGQ